MVNRNLLNKIISNIRIYDINIFSFFALFKYNCKL